MINSSKARGVYSHQNHFNDLKSFLNVNNISNSYIRFVKRNLLAQKMLNTSIDIPWNQVCFNYWAYIAYFVSMFFQYYFCVLLLRYWKCFDSLLSIVCTIWKMFSIHARFVTHSYKRTHSHILINTHIYIILKWSEEYAFTKGTQHILLRYGNMILPFRISFLIHENYT